MEQIRAGVGRDKVRSRHHNHRLILCMSKSNASLYQGYVLFFEQMVRMAHPTF